MVRRHCAAVALAALLVGILQEANAGEACWQRVQATIPSFDGTILSADAYLPCPTSPSQRFPVVIFANSWASGETEYIVEVLNLAARGYIALEYSTRGWGRSGGYVETAGPEDQKDTSAVISFVLAQRSWQPDAGNVALAGISYGAGISLLGAANDPRVKTAVILSGWANISRALFENGSPNLWYGSLLQVSGHLAGRLDPKLQWLWPEVLKGNESAFHDFAVNRSAVTRIRSLQERQVPLFLSQNLEDSLFKPQDLLDFFRRYTGPKRLLLNQGEHATAELPGLLVPGDLHIWNEVLRWLNYWLQGKGQRSELGFMEVQLRSDRRVRERFTEWPSRRVVDRDFRMGPRGMLGLHGRLSPAGTFRARPGAADSISFSRKSGISAGVPILADFERSLNFRTTSELLIASRSHAIWYYAPLDGPTRLCGTPRLSLDFTSNEGRWQIVAYLFMVNWMDRGTLLGYASVSCWDCTPNERSTRQLELHTFCEDISGGLGVALNLYSDIYQPANANTSLQVTLHYSENFSMTVPFLQPVEEGSPQTQESLHI